MRTVIRDECGKEVRPLCAPLRSPAHDNADMSASEIASRGGGATAICSAKCELLHMVRPIPERSCSRGPIGALIWRMPVGCVRWLHGWFTAAPQCRISVLARDVVSADPWLGRRGSLLASFGAGCGKLDRTDPRDRHLGGGLRSMCAS